MELKTISKILSRVALVTSIYALVTIQGLNKDTAIRNRLNKNNINRIRKSLTERINNSNKENRYKFMENYSIYSENGIYLPILNFNEQKLLDEDKHKAYNWFFDKMRSKFTNNDKSLYLAISGFPFGENIIKSDKIIFKDRNGNFKAYYKHSVSREFSMNSERDEKETLDLVESLTNGEYGNSIAIQTSKENSFLKYTITIYKAIDILEKN